MHIDFWTSIELPGCMKSLISGLNASGHTARQCSLISEASYRTAKSRSARLRLRLRQYLLYPLFLQGSLFFGRARKADVLVVSTNTFYAPLLATLFHKRVIHLVYDLFPEAMRGEAALECGSVGRNDQSCRFGGEEAKLRGGILHRLIRSIVRTTLRRAEANVFLGDHLRDYVLQQYQDVRKPVVIPVGATDMWSDEFGVRSAECGVRSEGGVTSAECGVRSEGGVSSDEFRVTNDESKASDLCPLSSSLYPGSSAAAYPVSRIRAEGAPSTPFTLLYCGNLGRMHDTDTLLAALKSFNVPPSPSSIDLGCSTFDVQRSSSPPPVSRIPYPESAREVRFLFHCSGPKKPQLESAVADLPPGIRDRIHIGGGLEPDEWRRVMAEADVALVTMVPGAEKVAMPSKTYSAMMAGQAILAICPPVSDLADTIRRADCGWVISPGDVPALIQALQEARSDPAALRQKQQNARAAAQAHYNMPVLTRQWMALFEREAKEE